MNPDDYQKVKEIFNAALEVEPARRSAFLDEHCNGQTAIRQEAERLLASCDSEFLETPAAGNLSDDPELRASYSGERLGHYVVIRKVGSGGMGDVYLAEDGRLGRHVAVKILPHEFTSDADRLSRFQLEARAASSLNHPNIITIHEIGQWEETHYIATEYVEGETLRHRLGRERLNIGEALEYGVQLVSAVAAAHEAGITHRDLKPENIMIRRDGLVKVLDFGLAKLSDRTAGPEASPVSNDGPTVRIVKTEPGVIMGTVQYMSPEQTRGHETDARTDIWSLGCVLYEMLAGQPPFAGESSADLIAEIVKSHPASLLRSNPDTPERLDEMVAKSLEKNPDERYQTAKDLLIDLKRLKRRFEAEDILERTGSDLLDAQSEETVTRPNLISTKKGPKDLTTASSAEYLIWGIKAHRLTAVGITLFILALLGGTAYLVRHYWRGPNEARMAYAKKIRLAAQALDASNLASAKQLLEEAKPGTGEEDLRSFEWRYLERLHAEREASQPYQLTHENPVNEVAFSPDGRLLATAGADNKAHLWDAVTGEPVKVFSGHTNVVTAVAFSPDGSKLATGSFDRTIKLWDVASGQMLWSAAGKGNSVGHLVFSPDGQTLAGEDDDERRVKTWHVGTGAETSDQFKYKDLREPFTWSPDGKYVAGHGPELTMVVLEAASGKNAATINGNFGFPTDVEFSPDSSSLLFRGSDEIVILYSLSRKKELRRFTGASGGSSFSQDGKTIAIGVKNTIRLWDTERDFEIDVLRGHQGDVGSIRFSPKGQMLASGSGSDEITRIWNIDSFYARGVLREHKDGVENISFSPDSKLIASASSDKTAKIWDVKTERVRRTFAGHADRVNSAAFSPDGGIIATAGYDKKVRTWDVVSGKPLKSFETKKPHTSARYSPDGKIIATDYGWDDDQIDLWEASTGAHVCSMDPGSWPITIEFSKNSQQIAVGLKRDLRVFNAASCTDVRTFTSEPAAEGAFKGSYAPDGRLLGIQLINNGRSLKLIDPESGKELLSIIGHESEIYCAELSPDGKRLLTCGKDDGLIKIWDVATGEDLLSVKTNIGVINAAKFSPDGTVVAAAGSDGTIRLFRSEAFR